MEFVIPKKVAPAPLISPATFTLIVALPMISAPACVQDFDVKKIAGHDIGCAEVDDCVRAYGPPAVLRKLIIEDVNDDEFSVFEP